MRVAIRTDASERIGSGHVMRCLTLAAGLREQGAEVLFVCRELPGNLNTLVTEKGFDLCRLPAPDNHDSSLKWNKHAAWLGVHWRQDAAETQNCLQEKSSRFDWLIVDHYALDKNWESKFRSFVKKIMVIDDLADRQHDCDLLLDQNLYIDQEKRYADLTPFDCEQLLGPHYAMLRSEFHVARGCLAQRSGRVDRLLVFIGGSDPNNANGKILDALQILDHHDIKVDIVVGSQSTHRAGLLEQCRSMSQVVFHDQIEDMATMMAQADLAVGAGGTTVWERACLGLPSLVLSIADNQLPVAETVGELGFCLYLGRATEITADAIAQALATLLVAPELLRSFTNISMKSTDGRGVERVARRLLCPKVKIRVAGNSDCEAVFRWRNAPEVRAYFFDPSPICWESHKSWFSQVMEDPDRILLIGEIDGLPVGVVRYDLSDQDALVSVYLVPEQLGRGYGTSLLRATDSWLCRNRPDVQYVNAEILPANLASRQAFLAAGYVVKHSIYGRCFGDGR